MGRWVWGVDIGGTKLRVGLVNDSGTVADTELRPTPQSGPEAVVEAIADAVEALASRTLQSPRRMGVGVPGPLSIREGVVFEPPNLRGWHDVPLRETLEQRLGHSVVLENDANAAACGEWWRGAARGARHALYVTVSTGIGGGLILDGRIYRGASDTAGEIGHTVVDPNGPVCPCGRVGHLEGIAAGPAIVRWVRDQITLGRRTALGDRNELSAHDVAAAATAGDELAREAFARAGRYVGYAVGSMLNLLNPEVVVIGGGVARAGDLLMAPLIEMAQRTAFEVPFRAARIVPAALGDDVGVIGAAYVALHEAEMDEEG
ncbi:MAG: ROK family protein [Armatimonadota bacterium]|nr:ROK family protein [Armatimonadota bacterium]MDR5696128.1 ROK family protein [Armatimonadota bacterium]